MQLVGRAGREPDAAQAMGVTSSVLEELGIVDTTIPEPLGGAHRDVDLMSERIKAYLVEQLDSLQQLPMEFAVEAQKLVGISLEGSVG